MYTFANRSSSRQRIANIIVKVQTYTGAQPHMGVNAQIQTELNELFHALCLRRSVAESLSLRICAANALPIYVQCGRYITARHLDIYVSDDVCGQQ